MGYVTARTVPGTQYAEGPEDKKGNTVEPFSPEYRVRFVKKKNGKTAFVLEVYKPGVIWLNTEYLDKIMQTAR